MYRGRFAMRALSSAAVLSIALGAISWTSPSQVQAGVIAQTPPAQIQASAASVYGYATFYSNANRGGNWLAVQVLCDNWGCGPTILDLRKLSGPCWKNLLGQGNWNDCISSVDISIYSSLPWPNACVRVYNDPNQGGLYQTWKVARGGHLIVPQVQYNDLISSIMIWNMC